MAEDLLQCSGGDALLNAGDGEGMPEHMGRDGSADMSAVGHLLDHPLDCTDTDLQVVMQS